MLLPEDQPGQTVALDDYLLTHSIEEFDALLREKFSEIEALWEMNTRFAVIDEPTAILKLETEKMIAVYPFNQLLVAHKKIVRVDTKGNPKTVPGRA